MTPNESLKMFAASVAFYGRELDALTRAFHRGKISPAKFLLRHAEIARRLAQVKTEINRFITA